MHGIKHYLFNHYEISVFICRINSIIHISIKTINNNIKKAFFTREMIKEWQDGQEYNSLVHRSALMGQTERTNTASCFKINLGKKYLSFLQNSRTELVEMCGAVNI